MGTAGMTNRLGYSARYWRQHLLAVALRDMMRLVSVLPRVCPRSFAALRPLPTADVFYRDVAW